MAWQREAEPNNALNIQANKGEQNAPTPENKGDEFPTTPPNTGGAEFSDEGRRIPFFNPIDVDVAGLRCSHRSKKGPASKLNLISTLGILEAMVMATVNGESKPVHNCFSHDNYVDQYISFVVTVNAFGDETLNYMHLLAFIASKGGSDTLTLSEAKQQQDWNAFVNIMAKEVVAHETGEH